MKSLKIGKVKYDIMLKAAMVLVLLGLWLPYLAEAAPKLCQIPMATAMLSASKAIIPPAPYKIF